MKPWLILLIGLLIASAAGASEDWSTWTIQSKPKDEAQVSESIELHYLINENQRYRLTRIGAKNDPRFELLGVDMQSHTVWLLANPFESAITMQRPANMYRCRSVAGPHERKHFYSLCNSRFAIQRGDMTDVDTEKLRQALDDAGFFAVLAETRLSQYRTEFAKAITVPSLKNFIKRYQNNDPEGLVQQARRRLPGQELDDYRAAFSRAMHTPIQEDNGLGDPGIFRKDALRRFAENYRTNDPERLVIKANQELERMLADDERQRQWQWEKVGELGSMICLEVHTNPSLLLDNEHWRESRFAQIIATTEQATPTKLKVQINRIMVWKTYDPSQYGQTSELTIGGLTVSVGGYAWLDRNGWRVCNANNLKL
jgi:hypothetical protein